MAEKKEKKVSLSSTSAPMKHRIHHMTRIMHGDNGGLSVSHEFRNKDNSDSGSYDYPALYDTETNHYSASDHQAAINDVMEKCCTSAGEKITKGLAGSLKHKSASKKEHGRHEKEMMHSARIGVGKALKSLGGKQEPYKGQPDKK